MEALIASYGDPSSSDSDSDLTYPASTTPIQKSSHHTLNPLPPPPLDLLNPPTSHGTLYSSQTGQPSRLRNFPHVEGNYALHVFIPVHIPSPPRKLLAKFLKKVSSLVPGLHVVDVDIALDVLCKDDQKLEQVGLGREYHISLGRTVPIRVHQIDSIVSMLRQKLRLQRRYWIDFCKWEVFVNDDHTRTFLSLEVIEGGLSEITKQIQAVNEVYKLHNLPEFYKDPRPHISLAWALGDISHSLKRVVEEEMKSCLTAGGGSSGDSIFTIKFSGIDCRIGNKTYKVCKFSEEQGF